MIARIRDDILQFFDLQLSAFGGRVFCVNYTSISLFFPRNHFILQPGARLKRENGAEAWLSAKTHDDADRSMAEVIDMTRTQALPFFEATSTAEGLLGCLRRENWGSQHHLYLEMAFWELRLGYFGEAQTHAQRAIKLYREDGRDWCQEYIGLAERLIAGIQGNRPLEMCRDWVEDSVAKLGLSKIRG